MATQTTFPTTLQEAVKYYADPENCLATAIKFRWPDGVTCPHCGHEDPGFLSTRRIWKCRNKECRKQFSAKVGTIFEDSPLPLDKWFVAMWIIVNAKYGVSSWELHRAIGVTQKTAWFMLHRIRLALNPEGDDKFDGQVEADETFFGGKAANMHKHEREKKITGRGVAGKIVVMGLLERADGDKPSRVKAKKIPNRKRETMHAEVRANVEEGAEFFTDAFESYEGLDADYVQQAVDHAVAYVEGNVHTNGMENFWSLLKRCILGTYVSVDPDHLQQYLAEQVYRFNERRNEAGDRGRFVAAVPGIVGKRLMYRDLIARPDGAGPRRGG